MDFDRCGGMRCETVSNCGGAGYDLSFHTSEFDNYKTTCSG